MKRIFILMVSAMMILLSSVVFASPQQVELNETYSVEQTKAAINSRFTDDVKFYVPMRQLKGPNDYTRMYATHNLKGWVMVIFQNGPGYVCGLGMSVPDSTDPIVLEHIATTLLRAAVGADAENYTWGSEEMDRLCRARDNAKKYGQGVFYCSDTQRYYWLSMKHHRVNSQWVFFVKAYVKE